MISLLILIASVFCGSCIVQDAQGNPYILGSPIGDFDLLQATKIQSTARPSFTGPTQCLFAQYSDSVYVITSTSLSMFSFSNKSWINRPLSGTVPSQLTLDHDTLVLYGLSKGSMYFLDTTSDDTLFTLLNQSPLPASYDPVVGFGQNHMFFLNGPNTQAGSAQVFVIHYAYWQPEIQTFSGSVYPHIHGKTASIPKTDNSVPLVYAFIPDDFSGTYLINTDISKNITSMLAAPSVKDIQATYSASSTKIYQLTSNFKVWSIDIQGGNWVEVKNSVLDSLSQFSTNSTSNGTAVPAQTGSPSAPSKSGTRNIELPLFILATTAFIMKLFIL